MRLYFLRHGPALSRSEWDKADSERPLSPGGAALTHSVAERIVSLDLGLEAILTSPYERAFRTASIVAETLDGEVDLIGERRLEPGRFTIESLADMLEAHSGADSLMLVGHEPSMSEVCSALIGGGTFSFKKAGLARVDADELRPGAGELRWIVPPKML